MTSATITVYPKGIECEVNAEADVVTGGSNHYGSDEPAWCEVQDLTFTRLDGTPLSARLEALLIAEYGDYAQQNIVDQEH